MDQDNTLNFTWTDSYLSYVEDKLDDIILEIYESEFIDKIFEDYTNLITREKFVRAINSDMDFFEGLDFNPFDGDGFDFNVSGRKGDCQWLFHPSRIRYIFKSYIKQS